MDLLQLKRAQRFSRRDRQLDSRRIHCPAGLDVYFYKASGGQADDLDERLVFPYLRCNDVMAKLEAEVVGSGDFRLADGDLRAEQPSSLSPACRTVQ